MRHTGTYSATFFTNLALKESEEKDLWDLLKKEVYFIISLIALTSLRLKVKASEKLNTKGKNSPKRKDLRKPNSQ